MSVDRLSDEVPARLSVGEGLVITFVSYAVYVASSVILYDVVPLKTGAAISSMLFLGAAYYLLWRTVGLPLCYAGFQALKPSLALYSVLASIALIPPAASLMAVVMAHLRLPEEWLVSAYDLVRAESLPDLFYAWVVAALLAPIGEEFVFRGVLQNSLSGRYRGWVAVLIASALFGLLHVWRFPAAFVLGALLGTLYLKTGSLIAPIIAHVTINSVVVLGTFALDRVDPGSVPDWIVEDASAPALVLIISLAAFAVFMFPVCKKGPPPGAAGPEEGSHLVGDDAR